MAKKISELFADLTKYVDRIEAGVDERVAAAVGFTVRQRMLQFISRGISPILGKSRFPEYLAKTRERSSKNGLSAINKQIKSASAQARAAKKLGIGSGNRVTKLRGRVSQLKKVKRVASERLKGSRRGYPYSVQGKYPSKRPRPVNLFLSGDFLQSLTFVIKQVSKRMQLTIGYFEKEQALKEKGHREGANGQPKRPTLPVGSEKFNQTIQLDIMKLLRDAVMKAAKSAKKG